MIFFYYNSDTSAGKNYSFEKIKDNSFFERKSTCGRFNVLIFKATSDNTYVCQMCIGPLYSNELLRNRFKTITEAKEYVDNLLKSRGHILLSEKQSEKYKSLV